MDLAHLREVLKKDAWIAIAIGVGSFVASLGLTLVVVLRIPPDYFVVEERALPFAGHPLPVRWAARVGLNLLGIVLVVMGVIMSLPGVPGQGLLTILFGIMLLDIPGKRELERRLIRRPAIHGTVNRLRARYGKSPILVERPAPPTSDPSTDPAPPTPPQEPTPPGSSP